MSTFARGSVIVASVFALVACAKSGPVTAGDEPELPSAVTASTTPAATADPVRNERGHIVKALGEEGGFGEGAGSVMFSIDAIQVDPPCFEFGMKPESGHTLLLSVRVATGNDAEAAQITGGVINPYNFFVLGPDGVTKPVESGMCTDYANNLPNEFGLNQQYSGTIEVVAPTPAGKLILQTTFADGTVGWEWGY